MHGCCDGCIQLVYVLGLQRSHLIDKANPWNWHLAVLERLDARWATSELARFNLESSDTFSAGGGSCVIEALQEGTKAVGDRGDGQFHRDVDDLGFSR